MNKSIFIAFVVGAAAGAASAFYYAKKYYERIAQKEIESVKAEFAYRKKRESIEHAEEIERKSEDSEEDPGSTEAFVEEEESSEDTERKQYYNEYAQILHDNGYSVWRRKDINEDAEKDLPYIISPDEYGDIFDYDQIEYTYYADDILADENNDIVTDWQRYMGEDALNHFGEYEEDSIYIRNDMLKTEYAVLLDDRKYVDVMSEYHPEKLDNIPSIDEEEDE